jgi:hypothetical protein
MQPSNLNPADPRRVAAEHLEAFLARKFLNPNGQIVPSVFLNSLRSTEFV